MKFTLEQPRNLLLVQGYGAGYFTIGGVTYAHPIALTPQHALTDWRPKPELSCWERADYEVLLNLACEILIVGCGSRWQVPPSAMVADCYQLGLGIEAMNTGAACRTYNLLASEGRRVAAALLPP